MNYKFIPVNNNLDKARAFANSLDNNFITNVQKIKQKEFYIPTLDVVQKLQNEGWELKGVDEAIIASIGFKRALYPRTRVDKWR